MAQKNGAPARRQMPDMLGEPRRHEQAAGHAGARMHSSGAAMDDLADRFRQFARRECAVVGPLYEILAHAVADDSELLRLAANAPTNQPTPNLLFAAVHQILLSEQNDAPLRRFY